MEIDRRAFIASLGGAAAVGRWITRPKPKRSNTTWKRLDEMVAAPGRSAGKVPDRRRDRGADRDARRPPRRGRLFASSARQREEAREDAEESDAPGFLRAALRAGESRAAERDARDEDRHVRRSHPRVPAARLRADSDQAGPRLVGRAALRTVHPEKSAFAIRYHQTLRFYADDEAGYEYPDQYYRIFGHDYTPPPYIQETYKMSRTTSGTWSRAW